MNPGSTVDWNVDSENHIEHVFVCPYYTEHVLKHFHPIISVDAAHLKSGYKEMMYIYSLTGNEEAYILAFGMRRGNEDFVSWDVLNSLLTKACPCVSTVKDIHIYLKYVFISDRDKGLDKSLVKIFPNNHAMNCIHHIKENVKSRFSAKAAKMVFPIAKSFSTVVEETLWLKLQAMSNRECEYLGKIPITQ